ncbi:hypothetical protein HDU78_003045 [Chytriomyces hyalinus]|nr:hypothetical protein HDU78_003045 [Chytriomyces hyalinus]
MNGSKGPSISATTAAAVGLGGQNSFSWGGLDPRDCEGPFVSSREEQKFHALLKTLGGGNGSGIKPGAGVIGSGLYSASAHAHFQAMAPALLKAKMGPKPKKHSSDESVAQRKHKKHKDKSSGSDNEEDKDALVRALKKKAAVNTHDATTAGLKFKKFPSSTIVGTAKEDAGSANRLPIRENISAMPADEESVKKEAGKFVPASAPKGKEKGLLKLTSVSALGPTSKPSEAWQHLPLANGLHRKQNTLIPPLPSHAPSTNSLATAPVSLHKKKRNKKNLFGIFGYQRAGNEAQSSNPVVSVKADDNDNA